MNRRRPLSLPVGLISLAASLAGWAQSAGRVRRIGVLSLGIEFRWAEGKHERLAGLAGELLQLDLDVLVAAFPAPALVATAATTARPGGNVTGVSSWGSKLVAKRLQVLVWGGRGFLTGGGLAPSESALGLAPRVNAGRRLRNNRQNGQHRIAASIDEVIQ